MSTAEPEIGQIAKEVPARQRAGRGVYERIKPSLDVAIALLLLIITAPVMFVAMLLVRLSSRGPAIYTQKRLGLDGRIFTIYKIRTMFHDCELKGGVTWSRPGDPRVTPVGRALRFTHLDELPQLINVVLGEMSLVGPRPERPEFLPKLERAFPDYRRRLAVRPGITGLAQVQQPPDVDLESVRRKLEYDLYYVEQAGAWLDLRIIVGTGLKCVGIPFHWIGRVLLLPDPNAEEVAEPRPLVSQGELAYKALVPKSPVG
jgi:lipopolysaccharide/colanic/teichoic acid biosynthesis glycosyltransferase